MEYMHGRPESRSKWTRAVASLVLGLVSNLTWFSRICHTSIRRSSYARVAAYHHSGVTVVSQWYSSGAALSMSAPDRQNSSAVKISLSSRKVQKMSREMRR